MFALKWLLMAAGVAMFGTAAGVVAYDVYLAMQFQKLMGSGEPGAAEKAGTRRPHPMATRREVVWMGVGAAAAGDEHRVRAGRIRRSSNQPDFRRAAGNAVSRRAPGRAAGAARGRV